MLNVSYSVVFFNNTLKNVNRIVNNILSTIPKNTRFWIYLINNSADNIKLSKYIFELSQKDERIIAIQPKHNSGFGAGHNLAIKLAQSDFHIIVNPDIIIPDARQINKILTYMRDHNTVLLSPLIKFPNGEIQTLVKHSPTVLDMAIRFLGHAWFNRRQEWFTYLPDGYSHIHEANNLPGSFLVFKTKILQKVGGFDERYFLYMEDSDISRTLSNEGKAIFYPHAYIIHEWQRENRKSFKGILQMLSSMCKYFNKWGWKLW